MRNFLKYFQSKKTEQDLRYAASQLIQQIKNESTNKKLEDWKYIERSTQLGYLMPLNTPHAEEFSFNLFKRDLDVLHSYSHLNDKEFQKKVHSVYLEVFLRTEKEREQTLIPSLQNQFEMEKSDSSIRKCKSLTKNSSRLISSQTSMTTPIKEIKRMLNSKTILKNSFPKDFTPDCEIKINETKLDNLFESDDIRFTPLDINFINGKMEKLQEENLCARADKINFVNYETNGGSSENLCTTRMSAGNDRAASNSIKNSLELPIPSDSSAEPSSDSVQNSLHFHSSINQNENQRDKQRGLSLGTKRLPLPLVVATTNLKQPVSTFYKKPRDWDSESISMSEEDITKTTYVGASGSSNLSEDSFEIIVERFYNSVNY